MIRASSVVETWSTNLHVGEEALAAIEAHGLERRFGSVVALEDVDLHVDAGVIHGLLGPNGAGKTTLLRLLSGLVEPDAGWLRVLGERPRRGRVGWVPSGDRSCYLRLSGEENLVFFGRLHGMRRRAARERARNLLGLVGLDEAGRRPVSSYSHGMQKRLLVARALLSEPSVLLVDEATHDLDPPAAERVRSLVRSVADRGTAVVWATQKIDEIRGFADTVTFLQGGRVRFAGTVDGLLAHAPGRRYILRLAQPATTTLDGIGTLSSLDDDHVLLELVPGTGLGAAIASIERSGNAVLDCRQERSEGEGAFFAIVETAA